MRGQIEKFPELPLGVVSFIIVFVYYPVILNCRKPPISLSILVNGLLKTTGNSTYVSRTLRGEGWGVRVGSFWQTNDMWKLLFTWLACRDYGFVSVEGRVETTKHGARVSEKRSNKGQLETGLASKTRYRQAEKKYYNRCYGGNSRQGQLMPRNGWTKGATIAPRNDLYRRNTTAWPHQIWYRCTGVLETCCRGLGPGTLLE